MGGVGAEGLDNRRGKTGRGSDLPRRTAYDVLAAVEVRQSYANLLLPRLLAERGITGRDAALATELSYGTLRGNMELDTSHAASLMEAELQEEALIDFVGALLLEPATGNEAMPTWVADLAGQLNHHCAHNWSIAELADQAGVSRYHLIRVFRLYTGLTPHAYQTDCRINKARQLLRAGGHLAELAQQLGFNDQSHFQRAFRQRTSITPGDYRRQMQR